MNVETIAEPNTLHEITEIGREKLAMARDGANDALTATTQYIKDNPWLAIAGAAAIGGALVALSRPGHSSHRSKSDAIRQWLDDAYSRLPSQGDVRSAAKSSGLSKLAQKVSKALHR